uniref:UMA domain-containing protein n=1 Tax=Culex tarsalis TaxID=7177 RepID=A0A1Q3FHJ2_CULTA
MFSFFKSKKHSPDHTPAEPAIPGPVPPAPKEDDFIFIERRQGSSPADGGSPAGGSSIYPTIPGSPAAAGGGSFSTPATPVTRQKSEERVPYLAGVPFKLSPELAKDNGQEITQYQVNEIMAFIGKTSRSHATEYDFSLERSVLSEG